MITNEQFLEKMNKHLNPPTPIINTKQVIVIRTDLNMRKGKMVSKKYE